MALISRIETKRSVLFTGAGFNYKSININNEEFMSAEQLKEAILGKIKEGKSPNELRIVAEYARLEHDLDLAGFITSSFSCGHPSKEALSILNYNWLRIYTTNYDNLIEVCQQANKNYESSYSYLSKYPPRIKPNSIIHLHGHIDDIQHSDPLDHIVLDEKSYLRYDFKSYPWYDQMLKDFTYAESIVFCGYGLADLHIRQIFTDVTIDPSKVFFYVGPNHDEMATSILSQHGKVSRKGLLSLSLDLNENANNSHPPQRKLDSLKSFKYQNPFKDKRSATGPTADETRRLLTRGILNTQRVFDTYPEPTYVVCRADKVNECVTSVSKGNNIVISGWAGNGKSVFLSSLACELSAANYQVFILRNFDENGLIELDTISELDKVCIIIDDYDLAISSMRPISDIIPNVTFIITVRTSLLTIRYNELHDASMKKLTTVDINQISAIETEDIKHLMKYAGVDRLISNTRHKSFRDLILDLFNNEYVRKQIDKAFDPAFNDSFARKVIIISEIMRWYNLPAKFSIIRQISKVDPVSKMSEFLTGWNEYFEIDSDEVHARSSVLSEYLLKRYADPYEIIELCQSIARLASQNKENREYYSILKAILNFSKMDQIMREIHGKESRSSIIVDYYDPLRFDTNISSEPLFWLQFSFAQLENGQVELSEQSIERSFSAAYAIDGYEPYQLNTHAIRVYMNAAIQLNTSDQSRFNKIKDKLNILSDIISSTKHYVFGVRAISITEDFVISCKSYLTIPYINELIIILSNLIKTLESATDSQKAISGSEEVRRSLERAINHLAQ